MKGLNNMRVYPSVTATVIYVVTLVVFSIFFYNLLIASISAQNERDKRLVECMKSGRAMCECILDERLKNASKNSK